MEAQLELLVEVDVTLGRPPRLDARCWTWIAIEPGPNADAEAIEIACQMAARVPGVVMPIAARIIDWN